MTSVISSHKGPKQTKCKDKLASGCDVMEKKQIPDKTSVNFTADKTKYETSQSCMMFPGRRIRTTVLCTCYSQIKRKRNTNTQATQSVLGLVQSPHNKQISIPTQLFVRPQNGYVFSQSQQHTVVCVFLLDKRNTVSKAKGQAGSSPSQLDVLHFFIQQVSLLPL